MRGWDVDRRERAPWKPGRGQYIRLWGTPLAVPEWAAFTIAVCVALLVVALVVL